jgi:hypothetical protein
MYHASLTACGPQRTAPQDRMHLDCVFSVLSDTCCIMLADIQVGWAGAGLQAMWIAGCIARWLGRA